MVAVEIVMGRVFAGESFVVKCDQCFAQYKLTPTSEQAPQRWLSCPSCAYDIDVAAQRPFASLAHASIFGADPLPPRKAPVVQQARQEDDSPFWTTTPNPSEIDEPLAVMMPLVAQWPVITSVARTQALMVPEPPFVFEVMVRDFLFHEARCHALKQDTPPQHTSLLHLTPPTETSIHEASAALPLPPPLPESVTDALLDLHVSDEASSTALATGGTRPMFAVEAATLAAPELIQDTPSVDSSSDPPAADSPSDTPPIVEDVPELSATPQRQTEEAPHPLVVEAPSVEDVDAREVPDDANEDTNPDVMDVALGSIEAADDVVDDVSVDAPRRKKRTGVWPVLILVGVLVAFVAGVFVQRMWWTAPAAKPVEPVGSLSSAMRMASTTVHLAALRDTSSLGVRRAVARDLLAAGRVNEALKLLEWMWQVPARRDVQTSALYAQALVSGKRWHMARQVSLYGLTLSSKHSGLQRAFQKAVSHDPTLKQRTLTLGDEVGLIDEIRALGGGKSVSFKMKKDGRNVFAFKPRQQIWIEGWRAEVAADVLCDVLRCGFEVPRNRPARIARDDFDRLYDKHQSNKQTRYRERFGELMFVREPDEQGKVRAYLYGTLKDWLPSFINWPLEYRQIWGPWLQQETSMEVLKDARLVDAIKPLRRVQSGRFYRAMLQERETLDVVSFADQISQLFVFDYLVTNWDRFSTVEAYYGANTHFARGRLISLDNGAAFHSQRMQVVDGLLPMVERFNRRQIAAIRALTPESLNHVLYPLADGDAKQRLRVFWGQRKRLLAHVDGLIAKYGEDAVLAF